MESKEFFGLVQSGEKWELAVRPEISSGMHALFGGAALGACMTALSLSFERPAIWASAQFLSYAPVGSTVVIELVEEVRGHNTSQVRALGRCDGGEVFTVHAALGEREVPWSGTWATIPNVPAPLDCPKRAPIPQYYGTIMDRIEVRLANARDLGELPGPPGVGRSSVWVRFSELDTSGAMLAILGDFVPLGITQALGDFVGGNSLDNTIRLYEPRHATEWILADIHIHGIAHGYGHGLVHLFAEDGALLATASQSTVVRSWASYLEKFSQ